MIRVLFALVLALTAAGCSRATAAETSPRVLVGAGATLPYPLYSKWSAEYAKVDPSVRINYQSIGSSAGIRQVTDGVVDFGATDAEAADDDRLLHVPTTIGAVVFAYNVPQLESLELTGEVAADIFLGTVNRWDDARITALNPGRTLPASPITVVHRADGSGTSAALSTYLSKASGAWPKASLTPSFPVGIGARGNEGVTALVKSTPFSIGYMDLVYARQAGLSMASVRNDAAYPIMAVSYLILPREFHDRAKGEALAKFVWWAVHDGQAFARALDYVELPPAEVTRAEHVLGELRAEGRPLLASGS